MDIPLENIFRVPEATSDQLDDVTRKVKVSVQARTKELLDRTGILADRYGENVNFGVLWERIKEQVMKPGASEDFIYVSIFLHLIASCLA